jgi:hypothetical protein
MISIVVRFENVKNASVVQFHDILITVAQNTHAQRPEYERYSSLRVMILS